MSELHVLYMYLCSLCDAMISECYCGSEKRDVVCGTAESFSSSFSCQNVCNRKLTCGNHYCDDVCHPGACADCRLLPAAVRFCACLKTPLEELLSSTSPSDDAGDNGGGGGERTSCLDPIPTCDQTCGKELKCGPKGSLTNFDFFLLFSSVIHVHVHT